MADEGALVGVGVPAAAAVLGVEGVLELRQRLRGVVDAEVDDALARALLGVAAEVGDQRVVGVEDEARCARRARRPPSPTRRPAPPSRRSGRAGRGRGCRARSARGRAGRRPAAARPRRPRTGPRGRAARAAPWRLPRSCSSRPGCGPAGGRRRRARAAIIPAVVVLPLVALTIVVPRSRPAPSRAIASGARRSSTRPGSVVPPPRPLARLAAPIARAAATLAPNSATAPGARAARRSSLGRRRHEHAQRLRAAPAGEAGRSVRCSPSA